MKEKQMTAGWSAVGGQVIPLSFNKAETLLIYLRLDSISIRARRCHARCAFLGHSVR